MTENKNLVSDESNQLLVNLIIEESEYRNHLPPIR